MKPLSDTKRSDFVPRLKQQLSRWAERDLAGIFDYTLERWGENQLRTYRDPLATAFDEIADEPLSTCSQPREELFHGCRSLHVGRHFILYRVTDTTVQIARVLHDVSSK